MYSEGVVNETNRGAYLNRGAYVTGGHIAVEGIN